MYPLTSWKLELPEIPVEKKYLLPQQLDFRGLSSIRNESL